ncbi:OmpA family protein [Vibrio sp. D420a]|jgi:outer membrane protein OmpA-like peptidoglycan-associated protein|uniref:OmpA family protein n=1 Tax=Vibrio sp. D420a TaxID=2836895 RepID=UPI002555D7CB|nr:OmpA family protein [Vibrio sp. D420a]MDK9763214.1 OmpA family protein [Vibrio sp. D420a]
MNKSSIFSALIMVMSSSTIAQQFDDEYAYLPTPKPEQIYDLQDDDNDGVINARDLCPGTPVGAEIDNDGCGSYFESSEQKQLHILFANNSTEINPAFLNQIRQMASFLKRYETTTIQLQGYASKTGNAEHNLMLSKERAANVRRALISNGIAPSRINIVGYGDSASGGINQDNISHALNRKVVASVAGFKGHIKEEWHIFTKIEK